MKKILSVFILLFALCISAMAQNKTIKVSGTVTDANDQPLIGVNVTIEGVTGFGTTTDVDGKYTIEMEPYNRLVFSYIGFIEQTILIKEQAVQNVVLAEDDATSLDEVIITGTGVQKKLTVTGAVTQINMDDIATTSTSNLTNMLAGNVPGVMAMQSSGQPGKNTSEFWVRGISTFGAGSSALVLVDGFPRDLNEISIEDIESFTVLKDASTTAIYGSKGANGVVLITTKKGKAGKVNVDAKFEAAYNTRTMTPEFADGYTYASLMNEGMRTRNMEPMYSDAELEILRLGLDNDLYPNVDWQDLLLRDGAMTYRGQLSLSGGGNTARYFISGSYLNEQGMYKVDENIKKDYNTNANASLYTYRMNVDVDITKTTLVKVGISGSLRTLNEPGTSINVWESLMAQNPISIPVMYSDGRFPARGTEATTSNPWVLTTQTGYNETWDNKIQTNITLEQKLDFITKGLSFVGRFGYDTNNSNNIRRQKMPELYLASSQRNDDGSLNFTRIAQEQKLTQESGASGNRYSYLEAELHYNRSVKDHNIGATFKYTQNAYIQTVGTGGDIISGIAKKNQGIAGRVSYNWKNRYFADFNFGYNGSENFAKGQQFGFFPAFSAAWNVAEEGFIRDNAKWINMFKIRYSYGKVGNDNLGSRFPYLYTIGDVGNNYQWADLGMDKSYTGKRYTQVASNNVTWEVATKHDVGIDLALFNDKFSLTVDYFNESREGIFMSRNYLPSFVGLESTPKANVGKVDTEGFDGNFALRHKFGEWDLTLRGNITYSKNTIIDRDEENQYYYYLLQRNYRVDQARGYVALGMFEDYDDIRNSPTQQLGEDPMPGDLKYKDINGDGVINSQDKVAIGATERPNLIYGVGLSARWKNFDFNIHFQGAGKSSYCIQGPSVYAFSSGQIGNILPDLLGDNRWIDSTISGKESTMNTNASYPRLSYGGNANNYQASTFWLRNGSYLRLKTLEIGYNLPQKWVNKIYSKNIRVFFIGTNLLTFSDFKLWDPEMGSTTGTHYPLARTYSFGFNISM